jgi:hypothetical protein
MSEILRVPIGATDANPFRLTSQYPYVERKIESLKRCFDEVGLREGALQASIGVRHV